MTDTTPPDGLSPDAAHAWGGIVRTLGRARTITEADRLTIEAAARAWARWRSIETKIAELAVSNPLAGEVTKTAAGAMQASPLRTAARAALDEYNGFVQRLGIGEFDAEQALIGSDIFGYPDRPGRGQRGRPPFQPTLRDRNKVRLLLAQGWSNERIASALEVRSVKTLRRYFATELRERDKMRDRLDARRLELAMEQANTGNISALRELNKMIERMDLALDPEKAQAPKATPTPVLGKKEILRESARATPASLAALIGQKPN